MSDQKTLTYAMLLEMNGEGYIPSDNRTYGGSPLSMSMAGDIALHIAMPKEAGRGFTCETSLHGSFHGNSSEETRIKAQNSVLHFPKASSIKSFIKIENRKITTLIPTSLIERYSIKGNVTYSQPTNIYYSTDTNEFVVLMDERFFDQMTTTELLPKRKGSGLKTFSDKKSRKLYVGIVGKTVEELMNNMSTRDKESPFSKFVDYYNRHFLSLEDGKRVIVIRYKTKIGDEIGKTTSQSCVPNYSDYESVANLMMKHSMDFEFFQAAQIRSMFYLMDESGEIDPKGIVYFKEEETDPDFVRKSIEESRNYSDDGLSFVIMPYSQENWDFITNLSNKLGQICKDLESFFLSSKTPVGELDKPFNEMRIGDSTRLLIDKK